jgi:hypothetical protein
MSQRTDGGPQQVQADMSGMPYGENAEFNTMQSAAPMSATPAMRPSRGGRAAVSAARSGSPMAPLFSPTQRPDEPVTAGAPFGPGDAPMNQPAGRPMLSSIYSRMAAENPNDDVLALLSLAQRLGY